MYQRHHHTPGEPAPTQPHEITYRGWTIDRWIQPDGCFYGYAPDYDGARSDHTKLGRSLVSLCDEIDEQMEEWSSK